MLSNDSATPRLDHAQLRRRNRGVLFATTALALLCCSVPALAITIDGTDETADSTTSYNYDDDLIIGNTGTGSLTVKDGGSVSNYYGYIGYQSGSSGQVTVSGDQSLWQNTLPLMVGYEGQGTLTVENGGSVEATAIYLGYAASGAGVIKVTGTEASLSSDQSIYVGFEGAGELVVTDGANVSSQGGSIGTYASGVGAVSLSGDGSSWNITSSLLVGNSGTGTLDIEDGAKVSDNSAMVGVASTASGTVTVSGENSAWTTAYSLYVGYGGSGSVTVSDGATVTSGTTAIGYQDGADGTVTVTGAGSSWTMSSNLIVGFYGSGSLTIEDGANVTGTTSYIGYASGGTGEVTVSGSGSTWTNSADLAVGYKGGEGTLTVKSGGTVSSADGYIGSNTNSTGHVSIDGDGSAWTMSGDLYLAFAGNGDLSITDGATVSDTSSYLAYDEGVTASAVVSGEGSTWTNTGNLYVGYAGNASLTIEDGGTVKNSYAFIGDETASDGSVTVTGDGSSWVNSGTVYIGYKGTGALSILDGASVTSAYGEIGTQAEGSGSVTISGAGSSWTIGNDYSGSLLIGSNGSGTLTIEDGASLTDATYAYLGYQATGVGVATVTGEGTSWISSRGLSVGTRGEGTLTIANGATVSVGALQDDGSYGGTLDIANEEGSTGTLIIGAAEGEPAAKAGNLNAQTVEFGEGTGSIVFNHISTDYDFSADINGEGSIYVSSGTTTLSGDDSGFTGTTSVTGGTLLVTDILGGILSVSDEGTIGGTGTIGSTTISSGGTISPGLIGAIGTLTVDGDLVFETGSTYAVDLDSTASDLISVAGSVTINGGTISVTSLDASTSYQSAQAYTIVSSTGSLSGTFSETLSKSAFLDVTTTYDGNNAYLSVALKATEDEDDTDDTGSGDTGSGDTGSGDTGSGETPTDDNAGSDDGSDDGDTTIPVFTAVAHTPNQYAVAAALDTLDQSGNSLALYNSLLLLSEEEARQAYGQLSGEVYASQHSALINNAVTVNTAINNRIRAVFDSVGVSSVPVLGYAEEPNSKKNTTDGPFASYEKNDQSGFAPDRFTAWASGFGSWGRMDGLDGSAGTDTATGGFLLGVDGPIGDSWRVGLFGGYSRSSFDTSASDGNSDNYHLGTYAGSQWGALSLRSGLSYTWYDVDTTRAVSFLKETLEGQYRAGSLNAFSELGYRFDLGGSEFEPFAGLAYTRLRTDGFSETGGISALNVDASSSDTTFTTIGLRASREFTLADVAIVSRGTIGWMHAFGDLIPTSSARFATGDSFSVTSTPIDRNSALIEAGLDFQLSPTATIGISYIGQFGSNSYENGANAKLRIKF